MITLNENSLNMKSGNIQLHLAKVEKEYLKIEKKPWS